MTPYLPAAGYWNIRPGCCRSSAGEFRGLSRTAVSDGRYHAVAAILSGDFAPVAFAVVLPSPALPFTRRVTRSGCPLLMHKKCTESWQTMHVMHRMHNSSDSRSPYLLDSCDFYRSPTIGSGPKGRRFKSSRPD